MNRNLLAVASIAAALVTTVAIGSATTGRNEPTVSPSRSTPTQTASTPAAPPVDEPRAFDRDTLHEQATAQAEQTAAAQQELADAVAERARTVD